jgi:hypothetical protein
MHAYHPNYRGGDSRRITVWGQPQAKTQDLIWKITEAKRAGGFAQVVEQLPSKSETLNWDISTAKKEEYKDMAIRWVHSQGPYRSSGTLLKKPWNTWRSQSGTMDFQWRWWVLGIQLDSPLLSSLSIGHIMKIDILCSRAAVPPSSIRVIGGRLGYQKSHWITNWGGFLCMVGRSGARAGSSGEERERTWGSRAGSTSYPNHLNHNSTNLANQNSKRIFLGVWWL